MGQNLNILRPRLPGALSLSAPSVSSSVHVPESPWAGIGGPAPLRLGCRGSRAQLPRLGGCSKAGVTGSFVTKAQVLLLAAHKVLFSPGNRDPSSQALLCHTAGRCFANSYSVLSEPSSLTSGLRNGATGTLPSCRDLQTPENCDGSLCLSTGKPSKLTQKQDYDEAMGDVCESINSTLSMLKSVGTVFIMLKTL